MVSGFSQSEGISDLCSKWVLNSNSVDLSKCGWQMVFTVIWPMLLHWHELDGHVMTSAWMGFIYFFSSVAFLRSLRNKAQFSFCSLLIENLPCWRLHLTLACCGLQWRKCILGIFRSVPLGQHNVIVIGLSYKRSDELLSCSPYFWVWSCMIFEFKQKDKSEIFYFLLVQLFHFLGKSIKT